jgi:hypothetical protein
MERKSKVCLECAGNNRFRLLPCAKHSLTVDPAECLHELRSHTLTHNGQNDDILCHSCGILLIWSGIATREELTK